MNRLDPYFKVLEQRRRQPPRPPASVSTGEASNGPPRLPVKPRPAGLGLAFWTALVLLVAVIVLFIRRGLP